MKIINICFLFLIIISSFISCSRIVKQEENIIVQHIHNNNTMENLIHSTMNNIENQKNIIELIINENNKIILDNSLYKTRTTTYYVIDNIEIYEHHNLFSAVITILPRYTTLAILETVDKEIINGTSALWVKIVSQTGFIGWCLYSNIRKVEDNIIEEIAISFTDRIAGNFPGFSFKYGYRDVSSIEEILPAYGYYIQHDGRGFQGKGNTPEILVLSAGMKNVAIFEIDIVNGQTTTRNKILLQNNGRTFAFNRTILNANDNIQIIYSVNASEQILFRTWDYEIPFTFAGNLIDPMPDSVRRLTSDYLLTFAGSYVYDSYKIIKSENYTLNENVLQNTVLQIEYSQERKCLTIPNNELLSFFLNTTGVRIRDFDFIETIAEEPFYWSFSEGVGFNEARFFFYKGGIAFTYEHSGYNFNENKTEYIKYVVFFRKEI